MIKIDSNDQIGEKNGIKSDTNDQISEKIGKKGEMLLNQISENPKISIISLAKKSGMAVSTVQSYLDKLRISGKIRRVGPKKGGHWELL